MEISEKLKAHAQRIADLREKIFALQSEMKKETEELKRYCSSDNGFTAKTSDCKRCEGSGKEKNGELCYVCGGESESVSIVATVDRYTISLRRIHRLVCNESLAAEILDKETYGKIFTVRFHSRLDIKD